MKKLKTTDGIKTRFEVVKILLNNIPSVMEQPFWKRRVSISEKISYLKEVGVNKTDLIVHCERTYPQLVGKEYSVDVNEITYNEETNETKN